MDTSINGFTRSTLEDKRSDADHYQHFFDFAYVYISFLTVTCYFVLFFLGFLIRSMMKN